MLSSISACADDAAAPSNLGTEVSGGDPTSMTDPTGTGPANSTEAPQADPPPTSIASETSTATSMPPPTEPGIEPGPAVVPPPDVPATMPTNVNGGGPGVSPEGGAPGSLGGSGGAAAAGETSGGAPPGPGGGSPGGAAGGSTEPAPTSAGCDAAGLSFCSDFESDALPPELTFYPEYLQPNQANFVSIDSTASNSGTRSLKVVGTDFSQMLGVATGGATFWGRVHLMSDTDIQNGHNTYVAATDGDGDPNAGEQIRIGEHQCQLEVNRKSDDAERLSNGGTYECSGGIQLVANTWYCLEFFYDGPNSELLVFVDGTEVPELHVVDWGPYQYSMFKFGFEKYHGDAKTLWYDDVALGAERVGCVQ